MEYINGATSWNTVTMHVLLITDLQKMLQLIAGTLPPTLYLPISPEDTLHFYRYLCTHILIENKQFLLSIDIPIQDRARQITVHQVFTLDIPHGNYSAHYDVSTKYFGFTEDLQQWELNSPLHNFRCVNKPMDSSVAFPHLFSH